MKYPYRNRTVGDPDEPPAFKPLFDFDDAIHWVERPFNRAGRRSS